MDTLKSLTDPRLVSLLRNGAVGVLPSDTIYGIVASAKDKAAVLRLYGIKHREGKPGTIIAADIDQLIDLGIERQYLETVSQLWPNPISIVLPADESLAYLHQGKDSLAVRIPADEQIRALLEKTGPLLTSSANQPGEPAADTADEARVYFKDSVDFYVEGNTAGRAPSTVALLTKQGTIHVLRQGAVYISE